MDAHVIDLNGYLIDSIGLLRQILGERVMLSTSLAPDVRPIQLDLNQLQVALIGIATRARDTMPEGGRFVIETGNVLLTALLDMRDCLEGQPATLRRIA